MYTLGLNFSHSGSVALVKDGRLVGYIATERLTRKKFERGVNKAAIKYVLDKEGIKLKDVSLAAVVSWFFDRDSEGKELFDKNKEGFSITNDQGIEYSLQDYIQFYQNSSMVAQGFFTLHIGDQSLPCMHVDHHFSHCCYAYYMSPFEDCLAMSLDVNDTMGNSHSVYYFNDNEKIFRPLRRGGDFAVGAFYSMVCDYLGFYPSLSDAGKIMALAAYGKTDSRALENCCWPIVNRIGDIYHGDQIMHLLTSMGIRRIPEIRTFYPQLKGEGGKADPFWLDKKSWNSDLSKNIAASAQKVLEYSVFNFISSLKKSNPEQDNLVMSGGTFLNCVMNGWLNEEAQRSQLFKNMFIAPASGDEGLSIGAAMFLSDRLKSNKKKEIVVNTNRPKVYHSIQEVIEGGKTYSEIEIKEAIKEQRLSSTKLEDQGLVYVVDLLRKGKIVAWFQGGSEIGPRALCHRSILADARDPEMKNKLNKIKLREEFRPVAPVVLKEEAISWFEIEEDKDYPFMLFSVKCNKSEDVPSALHIDESARIQTVSIEDNKLIWALLQIWDKATAVPMLINTSFNDSGMPIVESPSDALKCFASTEIDALFFVDHSLIVEK